MDGSIDHCDFNYRCLKPISPKVVMWNHILSNLGYLILGALFLLLTWCHERTTLEKKLNKVEDVQAENLWSLRSVWNKGNYSLQKELKEVKEVKELGTAGCYQLFYTMGLTLVMIGVMSSCYHICPTKTNFQFDTTFMYLLAIFMSISLFRRRHPDVSPDAITAFALLAANVTIGVNHFMSQNIPFRCHA